MSIDEQRTEPLASIAQRRVLARSEYAWLKRLSERTGVRFLHLYLLMQGRQVVGVDQAQVNQVLLRVAQKERWG